ncbi:MAG: glycerol-3-phosphate 1-O-acyltransferase PlsY [Phycisphaeraceae bacterium]|nr:glycerol-3-phosphate 1-O-acyltransferase PlsY [Phycisphaeraceae bacterium]MCW5754801.1 glycerol-3-phosphate 1-O-acyltransferase PlsY [Phycisphaeraceae bacterium]
MFWPIAIAVAFLAGSIPVGLILARTRGIDIRRHGSKNIGATNVARVLGLRLGLLCFGLDVLKGLLPTLVAGFAAGLVGRIALPSEEAWWWLGVMAAAIMGHMFSPWVGFRGGKGVATGLGALLGVFPALAAPGLAAFALWLVTFRLWRIVSLSSCLAAAALPVCTVALFALADELSSGWPFLICGGGIAALVIFKHRSNLKRLMEGTEPRFRRDRGRDGG